MTSAEYQAKYAPKPSESAPERTKGERMTKDTPKVIASRGESPKRQATNKVQSTLSGSHEGYDAEFETICKGLCTKGFIYAEWGNRNARLIHESTGREITITLK